MRLHTAAWLLAVTLSSMTAHAAGVDPAKATATQKKQAQSAFLDGRRAYDGSDYATAITRFGASLDVVDSPNTRLYLARSLREAGRNADAYAEFSRTEQDASKEARYHDAAATAHDEKAALESKVGFVKVDVQGADDSTKLTVGDREVPREHWSEPIAVAPGPTEITATRGGKPPTKKTVTVNAGSTPTDVTLEDSGVASTSTDTKPTESHADHTNLRPYAYVAGGVGAVGLITFVVAGLAANGTYGSLQDSCPNNRCPANQSDNVSKGKTEQTIANIGLVFGVLGLGAGATLFVLSMPPKNASGENKDASPPPTAAFRVGPNGAFIQGRF